MKLLHRSHLVLFSSAIALMGASPATDDSADIHARRHSYSEAMGSRNPGRMRDFLAEDMVQLSSNGETTIGRSAVIEGYAEHEFRNPSFIAYERVPDTVAISDNRRFAIERGHWRGRFRMQNGRIGGNSGLYQAGWIKRQGVWLIRTESYVRLHCADENDCPK
jgi:hypothetical protein